MHLELEAAGVVAPGRRDRAGGPRASTPGRPTALAERATTLITARLPPHTRGRSRRASLTVRVDPRGLHFFDPETELAV